MIVSGNCSALIVTVDHVVVTLPGSFFVWASTKQATFLHGRFVWCNWDVDELFAMKSRFETDSGFLKIGLQGPPTITAANTFGTIAEWDKTRKEGVDLPKD